MKRAVLLSLLCLPLLVWAQPTLFIMGNSIVHLDGSIGGVPTMYVEGGVEIDDVGGNGILQIADPAAADPGILQVVDFSAANRGSIVNDGLFRLMANGTMVRLQGHWDNNDDLQTTPGGIVRFENANNRLQLSANNIDTFGTVIVDNNATAAVAPQGQISLQDPMLVKAGGNVEFITGIIEGRTFGTFVTMDATATITNAYTNISGGGAPFRDRYFNAPLRRGLNWAGGNNFTFPVGGATSAQPFFINFAANYSAIIQHLNCNFDPATAPTITPGSLPGGEMCGTNQLDGYTGTWTYDVFSGGALLAPGTNVDDLGSGNTYIVNVRPHDVTVPASYTMVIRHDLAQPNIPSAGGTVTIPAGTWHPIVNFATPVLGVDGFFDYPCIATNSAVDLSSTGQRYFSSVAGSFPPVTPLPVEMTPLTATPDVDAIRLDWTTLSERNSAFFDLDRSTDLQNFTRIASNLPAAGYSNSPIAYDHLDRNVQFNTLYYYRLRQVDGDGKAAYSNIAEAMLTYSGGSQLGVLLYPNPANNSLSLSITSEASQPVSLDIFDAVGKNIYSHSLDVTSGVTTHDLADFVRSVAAGTYNLVLNANGQVFTSKVLVQH